MKDLELRTGRTHFSFPKFPARAHAFGAKNSGPLVKVAHLWLLCNNKAAFA